MRILVIEDNESVSSMIELFFLKEEIHGSFIKNGLEGFEIAKQGGWDCIIIDWMLPGMDGISICHKLRLANIATPIIMLTAKDGESDQVLGLEMGADDYVTKPFSPLALMARIKAVTRRYSTLKDKPLQDGVVETAHFKINLNTRDVLLDGVRIQNLTPKEFDLLYHFVQHPKQVFSREQLLDNVWGYDFYGDDRTVDVHIKRLRTKVSTDEQPFFHTVWGVGYRFDETIGDSK
ncbi:response regulator transcription factor [Sporosarcina psychrophila]|uniref:DNA-binding response OmpR family regulator n=1 Tax=Sporosarcina psychrophila TaxID=1476 RepID=A0ABV2K9D1_SPOPS|nr:response regulator transcription factor [Sporosarcina psychrophila]AMQ04688.1 DNA-binding response regulator [Sporosarcina psychrophila]